MGEATGHDARRRAKPLDYASRRFAAAVGAAGKTDTAGETDDKSPDPCLPPHQADVWRISLAAEDDGKRRSLSSSDEFSPRQRIPRDHFLGSCGFFSAGPRVADTAGDNHF